MKTMRIAWRNLWRNPRRTLITLSAMVVSTAILILTYGLMTGMFEQLESSITDLSVGEVQVHHPDYLAERNLYDTVNQPELITQAAVKAGVPYSRRAFGYGLLSSGVKSAGVQFWGIDPANESRVSDLDDNLFQGSYLPETAAGKVVLGRKLARTLNAEVGSELVVVTQAADGSLGNVLLTVSGILKSASESLDRSLALIHMADYAELFVFYDSCHEIALNSRGSLPPAELAALIQPAAGTNQIKTWRQLMPAASDMLNTYKGSLIIFQLIFFLAAGLGVLNTMLMATFERIPEFGLIKAIGATPWGIMRDIMAEALVLGLFSSVIGGFLGLGLSLYLQFNPIDLSAFAEGFNFSGMAFSSQWSTAITLGGIFWPVITMWLVSLVAAIYPASRAARLDPVKALNHV